MLKEIIESFLPWILYFVLAGHTAEQLEIAIIVSTVVSIICEYKGFKKGFVLSWATVLFFIFMFVAVVLFKNQWVIKHSWIFANGTLALIAWVSIIIRRPFTLQYAKEQVSKDKWQNPLFIKINYILTIVWGLIFLLNTSLHILRIYWPLGNGWIYEILSYVFSIVGIIFTTWFPNWYQERYMRLHGYTQSTK